MSVTIEDWERRKAFVGFTDADAALLAAVGPRLEDKGDAIVEALYERWGSFGELRGLLDDPGVVARLKTSQKTYFRQLFCGAYGADYVAGRSRIGQAHQRIGLDVRWYMGAFSNYQTLLIPHLVDLLGDDPETLKNTLAALVKIINLDQELAILTYIEAREEVIEHQHQEILELSTPVVQMWDGVVAAPIIGTLDSHRTQLFMERLLETIVQTKSPVALVDITGVPAIDTATAQHLIDTINSVKLLGAKVVITGVSPAIAQTLVHLGIDLTGVLTRSSLADGFKVALDILNLAIRPRTEA